MPAPFVNTGSDLSSTHQASALREMAILLQAAEDAQTGDDVLNNVTIDDSYDDKLSTINVTIPSALAPTTSGSIESVGTDYLGAAFTPGTSDLKSTSLAAAMVEIAAQLKASENAVALENRPNNVQIAISDTATTVSAALPFSFSNDGSGNTVLAVTDYIP